MDNTKNPFYEFGLSFQTYHGWVSFQNQNYFMFEYCSQNLENVKNHHTERGSNLREEILTKIMQNSFEAIHICNKNGVYYPEISLKNTLVVPPSSFKNLNQVKKMRETKLVHPFLFKSFFNQLSQRFISFKQSPNSNFIKEQFYENVNDLGISMLSLTINKNVNANDSNDIQTSLETVREERSPAYYFLMRKFDYFQKGDHFKTEDYMFKELSNCLMGTENDYINSKKMILEGSVLR